MNHYRIVEGAPVLIDLRAERAAAKANNGFYVTPTGKRAMFSLFRATRAKKLALGVWEGARVEGGVAPGPDTVLEGPVLAVETDHVSETWTRRAMTAQEISDRDEAFAASAADEALGKALYLVFNALYYLATNPHNAGATLQQFRNAIENPSNQAINAAAFRAWLKDML